MVEYGLVGCDDIQYGILPLSFSVSCCIAYILQVRSVRQPGRSSETGLGPASWVNQQAQEDMFKTPVPILPVTTSVPVLFMLFLLFLCWGLGIKWLWYVGDDLPDCSMSQETAIMRYVCCTAIFEDNLDTVYWHATGLMPVVWFLAGARFSPLLHRVQTSHPMAATGCLTGHKVAGMRGQGWWNSACTITYVILVWFSLIKHKNNFIFVFTGRPLLHSFILTRPQCSARYLTFLWEGTGTENAERMFGCRVVFTWDLL